MAEDDYLPEHERRLLRRHRRKTVRASTAQTATMVPPRNDATEPHPNADGTRSERTTGKIQSFRARALAEYAGQVNLVPDLRQLLEVVMSGARDTQLAAALGTDELGLEDLERRFKHRVGRSVYVAAVEVVNRAARLRLEALG
jgi:hypothetical protein